MSGDAVLIGFILSMAAGFLLQPYVAKIRWPKFNAQPEYLEIIWGSEPVRRAIGEYAQSVQDHAIEHGVLRRSNLYKFGPGSQF